MRHLTDEQVDRIARMLAGRLAGNGEGSQGAAALAGTCPVSAGAAPGGAAVLSSQPVPAPPAPQLNVALGVNRAGAFATVDECVAAARQAFLELNKGTLELRRQMVAAIRQTMLAEGDRLAELAWRETGLGRLEHKVIKNRLVTEKTPGTEALQPVTTTGDDGMTLMEYAPFGVLAAITPTTNPTSTIICNTIGMVAAGNAVVFNVHPGAVECSLATVDLINRAIVSVGGPPNLVTAVSHPTIESAGALMKHQDVNLLVVTGGPGVVKAAMQSGKRAVCAGPGNPPVVVDETADIQKAARDIVYGAGFDNNIICVDEKEVFVVEAVADQLVQAMQAEGAYLMEQAGMRRLEKEIFSEIRGPRTHGVINKDLVGKDAAEILARIGVQASTTTPLIIAEVPADHPLVWTEQLMPVLPIVRVPDVDRAIDLAREAEHGFGHSASMHSRNIDALSRMARVMNTSIFVKNGPIVAGLGAGGEGHTSFTIASPTGEGLTYPVSFSRRRRCVMVDHFRIV
jgi:acyl-CoA reductase-like NAD-dependent aldehyde dehydrogenase